MDEWQGVTSEDEEEDYPTRSVAVRTIALILILTLGATYAGINLVQALRRDEAITPREALADPRGFRFLALDPATNGPVRYDPCTPIPYVVNLESAPNGALEDIEGAIRLTAEATGITFVSEGVTDEPLSPKRPAFQPDRYGSRWAPLLIGWLPHDSAIFDVDDVGVGGSSIRTNGDGRLVYVSGSVILNGSEQLANGFAPGKTWGKVVLHELGHVIGLGHVDDPSQVMHDSLVSSPARWGPGDLAGLRELGAVPGCIALPPPG